MAVKHSNQKNKNIHVNAFMKHVKNHLSEYGMKVIWGRGMSVHCGGYTSSAYFSEEEKMIKIAKNNDLWLESLVHEYGHFIQWVNSSPIYAKSDKAIINVEKWFLRKKMSKMKITKSFQILREMERNCEMIASKTAKRFKLPINKFGYAKRANIYIYSHWVMEEKKKFWSYRIDPFRSRYILSLVPNDFRTQTHKKIPEKIKHALLGYSN